MTEELHTPTMGRIRDDFIEAWAGHFMDGQQGAAEYFDQALNTHNAHIEAAAEQRGAARGWDEGWNAGYFDYVEMIGNDDYQPQNNPYRADQMEGDDETH